MAPSTESKMVELKRLLRRLDGLEARRPGPGADAELEQRDYVGTLRGALDAEEGIPAAVSEPQRTVSPKSAALLAGLIAALASTATVYVLMSADNRSPASPAAVRSGDPAPGGTASPTNNRGDAAMELVRSASLLLEKGNVEGARDLLRRAAELGSGPAAFELARTYDPAPASNPAAQTTSPELNPTLARMWYERARELGVADAMSQPQPSGAR